MTFKHFYVLFFSLCTFFVVAQEPITIKLTEKDGLPDIEFYDMMEDKEGFMWFACNKGLYRYDGKVFKSFTHPDKKGRSLFNLKIDKQNRIWCNNISGQFFYVEDNQLVMFKDFSEQLKGILVDFDFMHDNILIKKGANIITINLKTKKVVHSFEDSQATGLGIVKDSILVHFDTDFDVVEYNISSKQQQKYTTKIKEQSKDKKIGFIKNFGHKNEVYFLFQDRNYENIKLYSFNYLSKKFTTVALPKELQNIRINQLLFLDDEVYFATKKGVFITSVLQKNIRIQQHYLNDYFITKISKDKNGNLWISSLKNGIWIVPNQELKKINIMPDVDVIGMKNDSLCYLGKRKGDLLLMNYKKNTVKVVQKTKKSVARVLHYNSKTATLFFATDKETFLFNEKTQEKLPFKERTTLKSVSYIKDTTYVLSSHINVKVATPNTVKELTTKRSYKSHYSKRQQTIYNLGVDGVSAFDKDFNKRIDILYNNEQIHAFDIAETADGIIWIASYDKGILKVKNNKVIEVIDLNNGLASYALNKIIADGHSLWIVNENTLQYYNTKTKTSQYLTAQDGLNSFNINAFEVLGNNVVFSNNLGVFGFDKSKVFKTSKVPEIYISAIKIQEEVVKEIPKYTLKEEQSISLHFNTKSFQSVKHTVYEYKFSGDKNWTVLTNEIDFVKFTKLPAGKFKFQLRAKNKYSNQYTKIIPINFQILAPFYKRWWFISLGMLVLVLIIIFYFDKKTKRLKETQRKELEKAKISKALVFSQLENLRSQMNPHFIFNALNSIQDYIILNEKKLARQYLVKFSRLIRIYLEHSQVNNVSIKEEINALQLYLELEKDRFDDDFKFTLSYDERLLESSIQVPSLFIQPYVENALKHGLLHKNNNKILNVNFSVVEATKILMCTIDDNGIGRMASENLKKRINTHKSFATKANQKRIDLLNATENYKLAIEIKDKKNKDNTALGTKVIIKIPIHNTYKSSFL